MTDTSGTTGAGGPDEHTPNAARMYDYFLGGYHNFAVDRAAAERVIAINPETPLVMRANRAFLRRAVSFLAERGVDQFLDVGSGIPTVGAVHEIARAANPEARVVYVDADPVAVRHSEAILAGDPHTAVIHADAREPERILAHPDTARMLDPARPTALLLVAVLHFVPDDAQAERIADTLRAALAPGSYVVISHGTSEGSAPETVERLQGLYARTSSPVRLRSRERIERLFGGLELVEPGLVFTPQWRPDGPDDQFPGRPERSGTLAGIGFVPVPGDGA
jgi:O-methyltransferase involved in polyketide biosynthesis